MIPRELGLFALAKQSLRKGTGGLSINTSVGKYHRETGKKLFNLKDNASTRTSGYKQVPNKFLLEIRKSYLILLAIKIFGDDKN